MSKEAKVSEMVDRVAKEVMIELHKTIGLDITRGLARNIARAAIGSMREPTEEMCQAYLGKDFSEADTWGSYAGPIQRWRAMIDAALAR